MNGTDAEVHPITKKFIYTNVKYIIFWRNSKATPYNLFGNL